jgi:tRNA 2-thiouridine synthesizing protein E
MAIEVNGKSIETTASGFLENIEDWSEDLAKIIADEEKLELTERHWDVVNFLRDEFINNAGNQPNTRNMVKAMTKLWGR